VAHAPTAAQPPTSGQQQWVLPRTPDGRPDLQGNWSNATITPMQRPRGQGPVLTRDEVVAIEGRREEYIEEASAPSDPDREAPPAGGQPTGDLLFDAAGGGTGAYNYVYIDGGDRVAIYNDEPRSSIVTHPADGRIPSLTPEAQQRRAERRESNSKFGEFDHPEIRPLGERCLMSFGSNAGPPMLPNYFYNNNYTIVQTADHVMILTEMVHDVRIIRLGERVPMPEHIRPWMGDSWGHWEDDTLVIETTNLPLTAGTYVYPGGSEDMRVIERLTRVDEGTINYEFTVIDPGTYTGSWGGEVPMRALDEPLYEYACHEGNYALANVLSGARYQERLNAATRK
jgi:hypothetical protein